jgi:hypothetical protein
VTQQQKQEQPHKTNATTTTRSIHEIMLPIVLFFLQLHTSIGIKSSRFCTVSCFTITSRNHCLVDTSTRNYQHHQHYHLVYPNR